MTMLQLDAQVCSQLQILEFVPGLLPPRRSSPAASHALSSIAAPADECGPLSFLSIVMYVGFLLCARIHIGSRSSPQQEVDLARVASAASGRQAAPFGRTPTGSQHAMGVRVWAGHWAAMDACAVPGRLLQSFQVERLGL